MRRIILVFVIITFSVCQVHAQTGRSNRRSTVQKKNVDFPEVPRASAIEAYTKYKAGKAIIIQCGGEAYRKRHIIGALNISGHSIRHAKVKLPKLPRKGIEIFTYCY